MTGAGRSSCLRYSAASVPSVPRSALEARAISAAERGAARDPARVAADEEIRRRAIGGTRVYQVARPILSGIARCPTQGVPRHRAAGHAPAQAPAWLASRSDRPLPGSRLEPGWTSAVSVSDGLQQSVDWLETLVCAGPPADPCWSGPARATFWPPGEVPAELTAGPGRGSARMPCSAYAVGEVSQAAGMYHDDRPPG
jgi:hypothetical protein